MEYSEEIAKIDTDPPAIRTAKVLQDIANSIDECIRVTYDTPENNASGKLPVFDLEVWYILPTQTKESQPLPRVVPRA